MAKEDLKDFIEEIKKEGLQKIEEEKNSILNTAKKEAADIIAKAKKEAESFTKKAELEAEQERHNTQEAMKQAGRDLLKSLEVQLQKISKNLLIKEVEASISNQDVVASIVKEVVVEWSKQGRAVSKVLISENSLTTLEEKIRTSLGVALAQGLEIKAFPGSTKGFKLSEQDGQYYDITASGIAEVLSEYMAPRFVKILQEVINK